MRRPLRPHRRRRDPLRDPRPADHREGDERRARSTGHSSRAGGFIFVFRPGPAPRLRAARLPGHPPRGPDGPAERAQAAARPGRRPGRRLGDRRARGDRHHPADCLAPWRRSETRIVGTVAPVCGLTILVGAVAMTKFQRVYEAAILRTLGASTGLLTRRWRWRTCALGLLAGIIGAAAALALSWGVARHVLDIPWRPAPGPGSPSAPPPTMALVGIVGIRDQ